MNPNNWSVETKGHAGEIDLKFVPVQAGQLSPLPPNSPMTPAAYQVVFLRSLFGGPVERYFVTIENDGPSPMRVWIDGVLVAPEENGFPPDIVLGIKQSATVSVATRVLVRPAGGPGVKGNYVVSWCCASIGGHAQDAPQPASQA